MKKILFLVTLLVASVSLWSETDNVAIMDIVDRESQIPYNTKLMLRSNIAELISKINGYEAYDRFNTGQTIDEYEFQRTGHLSSDDIRKIGRLAGVQHILIVEANQLKSNKLSITAKVLSVETARMEKTANVTTKTDMQALQNNAKILVDELFATEEEPVEPVVAEIKEEPVVKEVKEEPVEVQAKEEIEPIIDKVLIERVRRDEYKYGDTWLTRQEYYQFINNRDLCIPAYKQFNQGLLMEEIGKWTLVGGAGCLLIGTLVTAIGVPVNEHIRVETYYMPKDNNDRPQSGVYDGLYVSSYDWKREGTSYTWHATGQGVNYLGCVVAGPILMGLGFAAAVTGGTLWCVGIHKKDYAFEQFNESCATDKPISTISLNLQVSGNGLGLALHF